ncbi:type IV pilin protein [Photobacterium sp. 1_MG-2023]|uniref:type IV pilin protein n=1 Tax=Photobacterium sp. 1_MG-2023 TaxID=3062646 RepID=UPI0026E25973|nr:prepilin-type N-terminal cleavage/methylation domain-containing protein [Photobacterium sp. 1_MG-2023]MDO6704689.1 prepilin-type N-terminal cleavage/methylation domain-containing protein [Photobacterium sp. 1_MG-2023]
MKQHRQLGVTLIEMLIALGLIGILATIAYPAYQTQLQQANFRQAQADLIMLHLSIEQALTQGKAIPGALSPELCPACRFENPDYRYRLENLQGSYVLRAESAEIARPCAQLTLKADGTSLPPSCW